MTTKQLKQLLLDKNVFKYVHATKCQISINILLSEELFNRMNVPLAYKLYLCCNRIHYNIVVFVES